MWANLRVRTTWGGRRKGSLHPLPGSSWTITKQLHKKSKPYHHSVQFQGERGRAANPLFLG